MHPQNLKPAVEAILRDGKRRQRQRRGSAAQRKEAKRQNERARITLDLHPAVIGALKTTAEHIGCSPASLANLLLAQQLLAINEGRLDVSPYLIHCPSNRWAWMIDIDRVGYPEYLETIRQKEKA